jgi:hypothetical protein
MKKCYECRDFRKGVKPRNEKFLLGAFIILPKDLCNNCYNYLKENLKSLSKTEKIK